MSGPLLPLVAVGALALVAELRADLPPHVLPQGSASRTQRAGLGLLLVAGTAGAVLWLRKAPAVPLTPPISPLPPLDRSLPFPLPSPSPSPSASASPSLPANVRLAPNLIGSPAAWAFLHRLAAEVSPSTPIGVESMTRTPERQARAMLNKYAVAEAATPGGGAAEIRARYGSKADAFLSAVPYTTERWAAVVRDLQVRGAGFTDGHLVGTAIDLRTRGLTSTQVAQLVEGARRAGGQPTVETWPPHLHVEGLSSAVS